MPLRAENRSLPPAGSRPRQRRLPKLAICSASSAGLVKVPRRSLSAESR